MFVLVLLVVVLLVMGRSKVEGFPTSPAAVMQLGKTNGPGFYASTPYMFWRNGYNDFPYWAYQPVWDYYGSDQWKQAWVNKAAGRPYNEQF